MDPLTASAALAAAAQGASTIASAAAKLGDKAAGAYGKYQDVTTTSLSQFTKPAMITARAYIDGSIINEPVIDPMLTAIQSLYVSYILMALKLERYVTADRKVKDMLSRVATEYFYGADTARLLGTTATPVRAVDALESYSVASLVPSAEAATLPIKPKSTSGGDNKDKSDDGHDKRIPQNSERETDIESKNPLPVGKLLEVTLANPAYPDGKIALNILVQIIPHVIPVAAVEPFVTLNADPGFSKRYLQWSAGEISFFRDLIFNIDLIQKREKMVRSDASGVLRNFLDNLSDKRLTAAAQTATEVSRKGEASKMSSNLANTILVFSKETLERIKAESGIDLVRDHEARKKYFQDTFSIMLIIVDSMYSQVTLYINGMGPQGATYKYSQFKEAKRGNNTDEILTILAAMSGGKPPTRF